MSESKVESESTCENFTVENIFSGTYKFYKCLCCDKIWRDSKQLQKHLNIKKSYKCISCDRMFRDKSNLKRHLNTKLHNHILGIRKITSQSQ